MKKLTVTAVAMAVLALATNARAADKEHMEAAEKLLLTMNIQNQLDSSIDQMLKLQIKAQPQIGRFAPVMKKFLSKHMSWENLKGEMIKIYAEAFTIEELTQINAFYKTPAGKKMIQKTPELMKKGMEIGVKRVRDNQAELREMIQEAQKNQ